MSNGAAQLASIPVSLYVHFPWCVRKCPYCDFNSHPLPNEMPEAEYLAVLLADWRAQRASLDERQISSVFLGGGTPSLFHPESFAELLQTIAPQLAPDAEITMEANPGTLEYGNLADYVAAGINRLSMGVQSFNDQALDKLGRIHSAREARVAVDAAQQAGFDNINIDLMHGLPDQTANSARNDIAIALAAGVQHISWYQLTIEPRTEFAGRPPTLPDDDVLADIEDQGLDLLADAGFERYEISAYAKPGRQSQHNRNYWEFGDYLGIGAGAHGKLSIPGANVNATDRSELTVTRTTQPRQPRLYLQAASNGFDLAVENVATDQLPSEYMMNALRLLDGTDEALFCTRTGLSLDTIADPLQKWRSMGCIDPNRIALTPMGLNALDTIVADFLPLTG